MAKIKTLTKLNSFRKRCLEKLKSRDINTKVRHQLFLATVIISIGSYILAMIAVREYSLLTFLREGSLAVSAATLVSGVAFAELITSDKKGQSFLPGLIFGAGAIYTVFAVMLYHYDECKSWLTIFVHILLTAICIFAVWHIIVLRPQKEQSDN